MQSKDELEQWYKRDDPWGYKSNPEDTARRNTIISKIPGYYGRALDIGAGEGYITELLPAKQLFAYEISDLAASRLPSNITRVKKPRGNYDLIVATGVMYPQYDHAHFIDIIKKHASGTVLICSIKDWEVDLSELGTPFIDEEFTYREYIERIRVYENNPQRSGGTTKNRQPSDSRKLQLTR